MVSQKLIASVKMGFKHRKCGEIQQKSYIIDAIFQAQFLLSHHILEEKPNRIYVGM